MKQVTTKIDNTTSAYSHFLREIGSNALLNKKGKTA